MSYQVVEKDLANEDLITGMSKEDITKIIKEGLEKKLKNNINEFTKEINKNLVEIKAGNLF